VTVSFEIRMNLKHVISKDKFSRQSELHCLRYSNGDKTNNKRHCAGGPKNKKNKKNNKLKLKIKQTKELDRNERVNMPVHTT